ncbi:YqcI/YcgG family protein [Halomarina halobia]|uniref:YqcI/YcgG family protein n=1 Tax=Halomarina halobia TaxID=3033386 RepID=A0ABD6ADX8_9EURY|nr:YqcI/YcgG family protein [Halomarina sp. PSR21]
MTGELGEWKAKRYLDFHDTMVDTSSPFPCYFAVDAHRNGRLRYLFAPSPPTAEGGETLAEGLREYLAQADSIGDITSLVAFFEPPSRERSADWYESAFWDLLASLREADTEPWPSSIPKDPTDPQWTFCYDGTPLFMVARAPFYDERKSRYTPHGLEITIQPRSVFEGLGAETVEGQRARRAIRARLRAYDDVEPHPDIGDYTDPTSYEWKQYFLPESNEETTERFPLSDVFTRQLRERIGGD